ncbi:MAG TPA: diacylglycerol kinase family protein [Rubrobacter sp.]|nr:diacylglycerol kinase family protein [Rubrobacter sp.]
MTDGSTVGVIHNPASGGGAGAPEGLLRGTDGLRPKVIVTEGRGDACEVAREQREGLLVVAGGDGTVNEVVNGLGEAGFPERVTLAVLPTGTGNDWARTLGMPDDPEGAWDTIRAGRTRALDVARVRLHGAEERFFVNAAVGGVGAEVSEAADDSNLKARWGSLTYLRASLGAARKLRAHDVELTLDGAHHRLRAVSVVVGNCRYAGGGRPAAPRANPEDGLLDVVVVEYAGPGKALALAPTTLTRPDYLDEDGVFFARAKRIEVRSFPPSLKFNCDGEVLGRGPAKFSLVPRVLKVIVGPGYAPDPRQSDEARDVRPRRNA